MKIPLMQLSYQTPNGIEEFWTGTEEQLKKHLLDDCGVDIVISRNIEGQKMECRLTKAGDFAIEDMGNDRIYLKPRTRCTLTDKNGVQIVNTIIDLDARLDQVERIRLMEKFLTEIDFENKDII
tara:strand:+ start:24555 stop:24926 length:372 start_codon:yes stop_codon:yes gene_type:complete